mmetsp:Transcript_1707/g.3640  ORF Transcript_1707/g.3640 Transcript_1707/m.3640 type:complete len:293 (-) Transcript_1707:563-1441(-)
MDLISLRSELKYIAAEADDALILHRLQTILSDQDSAVKAFNDPQSLRHIECIKKQLSKHLLKAKLFSLISDTEKIASDESLQSTKSVHDIAGNFLWCQRNCPAVFNRPAEKLLRSNLFDLMTRESLKLITSKFGAELLGDRKPKVISFSLKESDTRVTARCSEVIYSSEGVQRFGILVEARKARHPSVKLMKSVIEQEAFSSPRSPLAELDPLSSNFSLPLKRQNSSTRPSPRYLSPPIIASIVKNEIGMSPSSFSFGDCNLDISISPYLWMTPEVAKRSNGAPTVSEFRGV